jgi:two-component system, NtrC family, sensor histidine kinase KinB
VTNLRRRRRLATKFLTAGALFVAATIACGAFCVYTFAHLSVVVGQSLRDSQGTLDLTADLAGLLEREDDALLLAIAEPSPGARNALAAHRPRFDAEYARLLGTLTEPDEHVAADRLREHVARYRAAVDELLGVGDRERVLVRYHETVNPILREAAADCGQIRELNFRAMERAGIEARDEARRATKVVALVLAAALAMSVLVALGLARAVVVPVVAITATVDSLRKGEFGRRVSVASNDELGILAEGVNRMADALDDFRRSNLGEVLRAKSVLEATLEALPDAVLVVDGDARIEAMNRRARRVLLGDEGATLFGSLEELPLPASARATVTQALEGVRITSTHADLRLAFNASIDGVERKLLPIAAPIANLAGDRPGAIAVLYDVTELARLDELRGEVVAVASHELKTPLTTIRMNLMLLAEYLKAPGPQEQEILATALMGCDELSAVIERLLDVARIEAGELKLTRERVDLRGLLEAVAAKLRPRAVEAAVAFDIAVGPVPGWIDADAARMAIVISNVLENALKYSPRGGTIRVQTVTRGNDIDIAVSDDGPGVPAELRERVFEKFFRVEHQHPERDRGAKGAGLGLYLSRQIASAHGGSMTLDAGPAGRGTRVVIRLPAVI